MTRPARLRIVLATAFVGAAALLPSAAHAGLLAADAASCDAQVFSQPFMQFADPASYTLAPGGDFEAGSPAWSLSADAGVGAGNEPWYVTSRTDRRALLLSPGASAT